jgi:excisionase family DNA binding protein
MPRPTIDPTIAPEQEALLAHAAARAIETSEAAGQVGLRMQLTHAGEEVTTLDMPPAAIALIRRLLKDMGEGKAVTLVTDEPEITTEQAAKLLHVSRPYVVGLVDKGQLPARNVGKQRRLLLKDVLAYKRDNEAKRREALGELAALDQELGLR